MIVTGSSLPSPLQAYIDRTGFWGGPADFDFWYALSAEEWFWLHLRRNAQQTQAVTFFMIDQGPAEMELYNLSRAPAYGLRATILNTPLFSLDRFEPPQPLVALQLADGRSNYFTLSSTPDSLADQWLEDALRRLQEQLVPRWRTHHAEWPPDRASMATLWPDWAGPVPQHTI